MATSKQLRKEFYKNSVIENYAKVKFSGDVAEKIRRNPNHLNFIRIGPLAMLGHVNWYWNNHLIERYGGNACVKIKSNVCIDTSAWSCQPFSCTMVNNQYEILFSGNFENNEVGVEKAAMWTQRVFEEIVTRLSNEQ